jgi:histidine phosphotransfer protein HptB
VKVKIADASVTNNHPLLTLNRKTAGVVSKCSGDHMIDWKRVAELREEIGEDGFGEVADMFLEEADQAVNALTAGVAADEVEGQLHFLKGSALNLGLSDLAAICQEGERKAATGGGADVDLAQVAAIYRASRAQLMGGLATGSAA